MTLTKKIWLALALLGIIVLSCAWWLIGTESGTRWALNRVATILPEQLAIGDTRGTLLGGLQIRSVVWLGDTVRVSTSDVYLDIELIPLVFRYLDVNELNAAEFEIEMRETTEPDATPGLPTIDLPIDISIASARLRNVSYQSQAFSQTAEEVSLSASLFGSDLTVTRLQFLSPRLHLDLNGRVRLSGSYESRARVAWQWQQSDQLQFAGDLALQGDTRRYEIRNSLTSPVALSTTGSISFESGGLLADVTNTWRSLEISIGERRLQSSTGSLRLQGSVNAYQAGLEASARLDELPETWIELSGDADTQGIEISSMRMVNEFGDLSATGNASWLPEQSFGLDFSLSGLDPSRVTDMVSGTLEFEGNVSGLIRQQDPEIGLRVDRLGGNVNGYMLDGDAIITFARNTLEVTEARVQLGSNSTGFSGTFGEMITLDADLDLASLGEIAPGASGALRGHVSLNGPRQRPDASVELYGTALQWADYSVGKLSIESSILQTGASYAELQMREITVGGTALDSAQVSASGQLDKHKMRISLHGYESELSIEAEGGLSQELWSGGIASLVIANNALGRWSSRQRSDLQVSAGGIAVSDTCLFPPSDPGRVCFDGSFQEENLASLNFVLSDLPLSAIPLELPADARLGGFIDAQLNVQSRERRLTGTAGIELRRAVFDATYEGETISVSFPEASGRATITDNRVDSTIHVAMAEDAGTGSLQLVMQDLGDFQSAISGQGNVSINDVSVFAVFLPGITNPRGKIEGAVTVSGSLGQPGFLGDISLTEGAFAVRQAGVEVVGIDVRLSQQAPGRLQMRGNARSGDGQIWIQGDTLVGTDSGIRTELILTGENFELARLPEWQVAASPSIRAIFDENTTIVSGALGIPTASITINRVPETAESPSPDSIVHRAEGTEEYRGRRIVLDVTTILGSDVRFAGFGLTAGVEGAVRLQGGSREPWIGNGTLNLRDGRYKAYGQELEIERGELLFNGPLDNPQLDIRAIRRADDVVAGIQLLGTPSQLRSVVFSEPALSDAEALSYLLTGRPLSNSSADGDILNNAAFALGLSGAGRVASQVRSQLGLETLTVEGGSDTGRIVAGKRIGNRLLVEYGYGLIDNLGTLLLRYHLSDRIVLESRTGTVSNLDVVYSVKKQ